MLYFSERGSSSFCPAILKLVRSLKMVNFERINCFEKFKTLPSKSVDAIISDPPYGISFKGKTSNTDWDKKSEDELFNFLSQFFFESARVLKETGIMFVCFAPTKSGCLLEAAEALQDSRNSGSSVLYEHPEYHFYYCRNKGRGAKNKLKSQREDIFCFTKSKESPKLHWENWEEVVQFRTQKEKPIGYALDISTGYRVPFYNSIDGAMFISSPTFNSRFEPQIHSTQKPFLLFTELIMLSTKPGETVFDPFAGSGVSGIAADCCGRNWIGCELDKEMFAKANDWIHNYDKTLAEEYYKSRVRGMTKEKEKGPQPKKFTLNKV
jgi:site-specific DNA-methyltransferase (adenine-specific)